MKSIKENYFLIIPILITILLYSFSLNYELRGFDENVLIQNFYAKKTLGEYIEKFFLLHPLGVSEAQGFIFSSIKNFHVSILGIPTYYFISFLFKAKPFLFHTWSLLLHCIALYFFTKLCYELCLNKNVSLFATLLWSIHPTNVEPVIWATNWAQPFGACLYFFTLYKIAQFINCSMEKGVPWYAPTVFVFSLTLIQILFTEHTITIPILIFFLTFYKLLHTGVNNSFKIAFKISLPSILVIVLYWAIRSFLISNSLDTSSQINLKELLERLVFLSPQIFLYQLKLIFFPNKLTIDQIDLLNLDKSFFGPYHILSLTVLSAAAFLIFYLKNKTPYLSLGLLAYLVTLIPFLQIIPLYSMAGERYNYLGSAFLIFGIITAIYKLNESFKVNKILILLLLTTTLLLSTRSFARIKDWENSKTLFLSTINTSNSLLKKGIWTYDLAVCENNNEKKNELLNLSINLLNLYIQNYKEEKELDLLKRYEIDSKSLLSKAALRIGLNYEILNNKGNQLIYLLKAKDFARENTQILALIYKHLGTYYFQNNEFQKAIEFFNESNEISPNPTLYFTTALCYLKLNDFNKYEEYTKKAASIITPGNIAPFKAYGQVLELIKNDYKEAIKFYKIASLLENSPEPYILLTTAYLKQKEINSAFKVVKNGLYGYPNNPSLLYLRGAILINQGKRKEGIKDLLAVVNNNESPVDIKLEACNVLVGIFLKEKKLENAKIYNEIALMIDPKNKEAQENAKTIRK